MYRSSLIYATIAFCAAINVGVGFLVQALRLPIYLDSIGTIVATVMLGPIFGAITGVLGLTLLSFMTSPTAFAYSITAIVIAFATHSFLKLGFLQSLFKTVIFGILLGVIAAVVSAPITTYLFGGVSLAGADAITAFFKATGRNIISSVILGGLATDPVDKLITSLLCYSLIHGLPERIRDYYPRLLSFSLTNK